MVVLGRENGRACKGGDGVVQARKQDWVPRKEMV